MSRPTRTRLDKLLVERDLAPTRAKAQAYIMAGEVRVEGQVVSKAGTRVSADAEITVDQPAPYVGRGGFKLAGALDAFTITIADRICADVGASTGGFTDVLLQRGAAHVYAIDVGYGQLAWTLRQHDRVTVMERTNARYIETLDPPVSVVVIDVSFISLKLILPAVRGWLTPEYDIVVLIKPQFEAGRTQVGKGGIVRDAAVHRSVLVDILTWCQTHAFFPVALIQSPVTGAGGNIEFLAWLKNRPNPDFDPRNAADALLPPTDTAKNT